MFSLAQLCYQNELLNHMIGKFTNILGIKSKSDDL